MPSYSSFKSIWITNLKENNKDTDGWDYQCSYLNMINNRLSIIPNKNLISNIGHYNNATCSTQNHPLAGIELNELDKIIHLTLHVINVSADIYLERISNINKSRRRLRWL